MMWLTVSLSLNMRNLYSGEQQMPAQLYQSPTGHELEIIPVIRYKSFQ